MRSACGCISSQCEQWRHHAGALTINHQKECGCRIPCGSAHYSLSSNDLVSSSKTSLRFCTCEAWHKNLLAAHAWGPSHIPLPQIPWKFLTSRGNGQSMTLFALCNHLTHLPVPLHVLYKTVVVFSTNFLALEITGRSLKAGEDAAAQTTAQPKTIFPVESIFIYRSDDFVGEVAEKLPFLFQRHAIRRTASKKTKGSGDESLVWAGVPGRQRRLGPATGSSECCCASTRRMDDERGKLVY
jgi:hypothetical protein